MNREEIATNIITNPIFKVFACFLMSLIFAMICFMTVFMVDLSTLKEIGEQSVPCLDEINRPFENEMCTETLYCSWLGIAAEDRCVNVGEKVT